MFVSDDGGHPDFAGINHLHVDAGVGKYPEHQLAHTGVTPQTDAHHTQFRDVLIVADGRA